jgi:hypothetical protein
MEGLQHRALFDGPSDYIARRGDERKIRSEQLDCLEPVFIDSQ